MTFQPCKLDLRDQIKKRAFSPAPGRAAPSARGGDRRAIKGRLAFDFAGHFVGFFDEAVDRRWGDS
jgi:hypothetical protein